MAHSTAIASDRPLTLPVITGDAIASHPPPEVGFSNLFAQLKLERLDVGVLYLEVTLPVFFVLVLSTLATDELVCSYGVVLTLRLN